MKIKLSIQEIVNDYEICLREDERIKLFEEMEMLKEEDTDKSIITYENMCEKYIPNYKDKTPSNYNNKTSYQKHIVLNTLLENNFREMIYNLV